MAVFFSLRVCAFLFCLRCCCGLTVSSRCWRISKLYSSNPRRGTSSEHERSRYNEKLINDAKKLRDEIFLLELQSINDLSKGVIVEDNSSAKTSCGNNFSRDEFISRFPIERTLNATTIFTLGSFKSDSSSTSNISEASNGTYISVLVEREREKERKEAFLDKISGMSSSNLRATDSTTKSASSPGLIIETILAQEETIMEKSSANAKRLPIVRSQEKEPSNDIISSFQLSIETQMTMKLEKAGLLYNPSDYPKPVPAAVLTTSLDSCLLKSKGADGVDRYELMTVDDILNSANTGWTSKILLQAFSWIMLSSVDRKLIRNKDDVRILEASFASVLIDFLAIKNEQGFILDNKLTPEIDASLKTELAFLSYVRDATYRAFLKADWIKFKLRQEIPNVAALQLLIAAQASASDDISVDMLTLWRMTTLERLSRVTQEALNERDAIWGLKVDVPSITTISEIVDSYVATSEVAEVGLFSRLNSYLERQVITAENDLAEVLGDRIVPTDKNGTLFRGGQGQDIIATMIQGKATLSPALLALQKSLNSTQQSKLKSSPTQPRIELYPNKPSEIVSDIVSTALNANSTSDRLEIDITGMSSDKLDELSTMSPAELTEFLTDSGFSNLITTFGALDEMVFSKDERGTTAECFISDYFDTVSKTQGLVISREGAGRFQLEMLKDIFVVTSVKTCQGAVIFNGRYKAKSSCEFTDMLEKRYSSSGLADEVGYTVMKNSIYPNEEDPQQQQVLDRMLGESPAVVIFPKTWTTTVDLYGKSPWRKLLSFIAIISSFGFSAGCFGMFNVGSSFMTNGIIPMDLVPLALLPIGIQYSTMVFETFVGKMKGFNVTSVILPSFSIFNYGTRSVYTTMPKNRNDVFDTAALSISFALMCSLIAMYIGLQLTASTPAEVLPSYPSISLTIMDTNTVVREVLSFEFPTIFQRLAEAKKATDLISGGNGEGGGDAQVHLHWLAIAGAVSFITNTLQLIPVDNSAGSKMGSSVTGKDNFTIFTVVFGIMKAILILPTLFTMTARSLVSSPRLLTDYFLTSVIQGNGQVETCLCVLVCRVLDFENQLIRAFLIAGIPNYC